MAPLALSAFQVPQNLGGGGSYFPNGVGDRSYDGKFIFHCVIVIDISVSTSMVLVMVLVSLVLVLLVLLLSLLLFF